jgi:hypothetical protein
LTNTPDVFETQYALETNDLRNWRSGVLDVDSAVTSGDPYADLKNGFAAATAALTTSAVAGVQPMAAPLLFRRHIMPARSARLPECGKIPFRRIPMRVKWLPSLTSC